MLFSTLLLKVFAPIVFDHHWWCYALNRENKMLYVLDSLEGRHKGDKAQLDKLAVFYYKQLDYFILYLSSVFDC